MTLTIVIDRDTTEDELRAVYVAVGSLLGEGQPTTKASTVAGGWSSSKPEPEETKKAAPPAAKAKPEPEAEKETPAEDASEPVLKDAVELATKLVSTGKSADVKAALGKLGVTRVSNLPEDKVGEFISLLS